MEKFTQSSWMLGKKKRILQIGQEGIHSLRTSLLERFYSFILSDEVREGDRWLGALFSWVDPSWDVKTRAREIPIGNQTLKILISLALGRMLECVLLGLFQTWFLGIGGVRVKGSLWYWCKASLLLRDGSDSCAYLVSVCALILTEDESYFFLHKGFSTLC